METKIMAKKSLYIFLSSLLGVLLFLVLHRAGIFIYLYLITQGYVVSSWTYLQFLVFDYFTLTLTLLFGAWYGIWLGVYWYEKVYVECSHSGFVAHMSNKFMSHKNKGLESKISHIKERLETDLWQLEDLAKTSLSQVSAPAPIKRKIVRKAAPRKLKTAKA